MQRARFSIEEVVRLTMEFYKRNYIEGLFLSSGVIRSPDETMGELVEVARRLRVEEKFGGYIHLKTIPECDPGLLALAGQYADRLSINVELPTDESVKKLAPEKRPETIRKSMATLRLKIEEKSEPTLRTKKRERFAPGGQSTQMIIGADATADAGILQASSRLYGSYHLRRVYYSAFSPIPDSSSALPLIKPPLMREHRLYQADWLMRFYGFAQGEILDGQSRRHARPRHRSEARLVAAPPRAPSRSTSTAPTARRCCACRASAPRRSSASSRHGATGGCGWRMSAGSASPSPRSGPSSSPKAGSPAS